MRRKKIIAVAFLVALLLVGAVGLAAASGPAGPGQSATLAQLGDLPEIRVRFAGCIEAVDLDAGVGSITVGGYPFQITADTEVDGTLEVGACVRIEAVLRFDSSEGFALIATQVEVRDDSQEPQCLEFYGELQVMGDTWEVVGGPPFVVNAATEMDGVPQVGDMIKVEVCRAAAGQWHAVEIKVLHGEHEEDEEVEFRGPIVEIMDPPSDGFAHVWTVGQWLVGIPSGVEVEGTPHVGDRVEIKGHRAPADSEVQVIAEEVELEERHDRMGRVKIEAAITTVGDANTPWAFEGIPVATDGNTVILNHEGLAEVGVWAKVWAVLREDNALYARRIETEHEDDEDEHAENTLYFEGPFQSSDDTPADGENWTIGGVTFFVPDELLDDLDHAPATGDKIELKATHTDDMYEVVQLDLEHEED